MEPIHFLFLAVLVIIVMGGFFSSANVAKRKLKKSALVAIAKVKEGEVVKIRGKVEARGELLKAPLSGAKCVAYQVIVEREHDDSTSEMIAEVEFSDFCLRDGDHLVFINLKCKKELLFDKDYLASSGMFNDASPHLEAFLERKGSSSATYFGFNKSLSYKEGKFEVGEMITVLGEAHWEWAEDHGIKEPFKKVLFVTAPKGGRLYMGDVV